MAAWDGRPPPRASGQDPSDARREHEDGRSVAHFVAREASSVQAEAACSVIARGTPAVATAAVARHPFSRGGCTHTYLSPNSCPNGDCLAKLSAARA
eukprot:scaffold3028_cov94-Isochrysis_galbana.AAC.2